MLRFDADKHVYWWGAYPVPSVTQILGDNGWISDFCKSKTHADKGTDIHRMVELAVKLKSFAHYDAYGSLKVEELDRLRSTYPEQYRQWQEFLQDTGFEVYSSEVMSHGSISLYDGSEDFDYWPDWAGTRDLSGWMPSIGKWAIVDMKTGSNAPPHTNLQTAAYTLAEHPLDYREVSRWSLRLDGKPGKKYKLKEYHDPEDFRKWIEEVKRWQRNQSQIHQ